MFRWLKRRRRGALRRRPFPQAWEDIIERNVPQWRSLDPDEREQMKGHIHVFLAEKTFQGCGGLAITDEIRLTIAAQACLLLLHREGDYFPRMTSILVYPSHYATPVRQRAAGGFVIETEQTRLGESWYRGPVVLSWDGVLHGASDVGDGRNVVLHEFAHQLDSADGAVDGAPDLGQPERYAAWAWVLGEEYQDLVERMHAHRGSIIRGYGATSPAEFFAVVTEVFFEKPADLQRRHPELYEQFKAFYKQDPAARMSNAE